MSILVGFTLFLFSETSLPAFEKRCSARTDDPGITSLLLVQLLIGQ